jgi:hypothetical protein
MSFESLGSHSAAEAFLFICSLGTAPFSHLLNITNGIHH